MSHAVAEEKTTTGQDQANDPIGDWVVNTVELPQYKDAFKALFRNSNLENIGTVSSSTFEKAIIKMMGDDNIDFGHLSQFTGAHSKLSQPQSAQGGGQESSSKEATISPFSNEDLMKDLKQRVKLLQITSKTYYRDSNPTRESDSCVSVVLKNDAKEAKEKEKDVPLELGGNLILEKTIQKLMDCYQCVMLLSGHCIAVFDPIFDKNEAYFDVTKSKIILDIGLIESTRIQNIKYNDKNKSDAVVSGVHSSNINVSVKNIWSFAKGKDNEYHLWVPNVALRSIGWTMVSDWAVLFGDQLFEYEIEEIEFMTLEELENVVKLLCISPQVVEDRLQKNNRLIFYNCFAFVFHILKNLDGTIKDHKFLSTMEALFEGNSGFPGFSYVGKLGSLYSGITAKEQGRHSCITQDVVEEVGCSPYDTMVKYQLDAANFQAFDGVADANKQLEKARIDKEIVSQLGMEFKMNTSAIANEVIIQNKDLEDILKLGGKNSVTTNDTLRLS